MVSLSLQDVCRDSPRQTLSFFDQTSRSLDDKIARFARFGPTNHVARLDASFKERWSPQPTSKTVANQGPWDDVKDAWGRGGYIESAVPRECKSYLPREVLWYMNHLELDHFDKESFTTAMRRDPKRYVKRRVVGVLCQVSWGRRRRGLGLIPTRICKPNLSPRPFEGT